MYIKGVYIHNEKRFLYTLIYILVYITGVYIHRCVYKGCLYTEEEQWIKLKKQSIF